MYQTRDIHLYIYIIKLESLTEDWIRVMVFKAGGHYAYSNYAKTVNKAVSELLNKVVKDPLEKGLNPIASSC